MLVFDTTLRDVESNLPGDCGELVVADALAELGVDIMEAGFPAAAGDFEAVRAIAGRVGASRWQALPAATSTTSSRPPWREAPRIHVSPPPTFTSNTSSVGREQVIERVDRMVKFAKGFTSDVEFSSKMPLAATGKQYVTVVLRSVTYCWSSSAARRELPAMSPPSGNAGGALALAILRPRQSQAAA